MTLTLKLFFKIMTITFYKFTGLRNSFPKSLGKGFSITGNLREETNITNPSIVIENMTPNNQYNYVYIPDFRRYYYIVGMTSISANLIRFDLHCDVLQSFSNDILNSIAFVKRNQYYYDKWLVDDLIPTYPTEDEYVNLVAENPFISNTPDKLTNLQIVISFAGVVKQ